MKFKLVCKVCGDVLWIRGSYDPSCNAHELDDSDPRWKEACIHMEDGGDFDVTDEEPTGDIPEPEDALYYGDR